MCIDAWVRSASCGLVAATLIGGAAVASAQRVISVTVADDQGRPVSGLERDHFRIQLGGAGAPVTAFSAPESPISLAVVSAVSLPEVADLVGPNDELIETSSLEEAVQRLAQAKHFRRTIILTEPSSLRLVPDDIRVIQSGVDDLQTLAEELRGDYLLGFAGPARQEGIVVSLQPTFAALHLTVQWKTIL